MYFWTNLKLSYRMYKFHRYEFDKHFLMMFCLQSFTLIALLYKASRSLLWEYRWYCEKDMDDMRLTYA